MKIGVKLVKLAAVDCFIQNCMASGYPTEQIVRQLQLYCTGVRDSRLCDNAISLIDGEVEIPVDIEE